MASRLVLRSLRTQGLARPAVLAPRVLAVPSVRYMATQNQSPDERAASIINAVPSSSLWTKTGGVVLGTALTAAAVSTELYVVNEETVLAVGFFIIVAIVARTMSAPYTAWAEGHINRIKDTLNSARAEHASAVTSRIDSVNLLKDVVPLTEQLYAVARETNALENENFLHQQEAVVKSEVKAVLDSWDSNQQHQREAEQIALVESVRASIDAELAKPAFKGRLLEEAMAQAEQLAKSKAI